MNKNEFIQKLKYELKEMKTEDVNDILQDYEEHFAEGSKNGQSEKEIIEELGTPKEIAKELRTYSVIEKAEKKFSLQNIFEVGGAILSLGIFNVILLFPYFFVILGLIGAGFAAFALLIGGIGGFAISVINSVTYINIFSITHDLSKTLISSSLAIFGGIVIGALDYFAIKTFYKFTIKYIKMNITLIKDKE
jgi:uncharacterized membrane protein